MARPDPVLVDALRRAAARLERGAPYQWGHHGRCNCGHLAQELTHRTAAEIHAFALEKAGDWAEHAIDTCPTSDLPIDHVIACMLAAGLDRDDLVHLERLDDRRVVRALGERGPALRRNSREDAVRYMRAWADLLEDELAVAPGPERVADALCTV